MPTPDRRPFVADEGWRRVSPPSPPGGEIPPLTEEELAELVELQRQANVLLTDIRQELREQVQLGYVYPTTQPVTGRRIEKLTFNPKLFSVAMTNDGPGPVEYKIPATSAVFVVLAVNEVHTFNFIKGLISEILMICPTLAGTATVRVVGTY